MGVDGLLKALADVQRPVHIDEYRGLRVALDGHCFLHKGKASTSACMDLLAGRVTDAFLRPLLETVHSLRAVEATPIVVFDGGNLPAKLATEEVRKRAREEAQRKSLERLRAGQNISQAVDVTPEMVAFATKKLQELNVESWVAPYEADAQLAHLSLTGYVDVCISLDGDLLAYGCQRVMFGIDSNNQGREVRLKDIVKSRGLAPYWFRPEALPDLCVLSGCDYLASIPRIGLKTASQLLHGSGGDLKRALRLARSKGFAVPAGYEQRMLDARLVFASQTVYDIKDHLLVPLRPLPPAMDGSPHFLGPLLPVDIARAIARGDVHPVTFARFSAEISGHLADCTAQNFKSRPSNDECTQALNSSTVRPPSSCHPSNPATGSITSAAAGPTSIDIVQSSQVAISSKVPCPLQLNPSRTCDQAGTSGGNRSICHQWLSQAEAPATDPSLLLAAVFDAGFAAGVQTRAKENACLVDSSRTELPAGASCPGSVQVPTQAARQQQSPPSTKRAAIDFSKAIDVDCFDEAQDASEAAVGQDPSASAPSVRSFRPPRPSTGQAAQCSSQDTSKPVPIDVASPCRNAALSQVAPNNPKKRRLGCRIICV